MQRRLYSLAAAGVLLSPLLAGCGAEADADILRVEEVPAVTIPSPERFGDDAYLTMPHIALRLKATSVVTELNERTARDLGFEGEISAADGQEFVIARVVPTNPPYDNVSASAEIEAGDQQLDVTDVVANPDSYGPADNAIVVASVDQGAPVILRVTDEGKTVGIDLRTGERTDEADAASTAAYYGPGAMAELAGELTASAVVGPIEPAIAAIFPPDEASTTVSFDGATAQRHAWLQDIGWAPDGHAFLVITGIVTHSTSLANLCVANWSGTSLTLAPTGGQPAPSVSAFRSRPIDKHRCGGGFRRTG